MNHGPQPISDWSGPAAFLTAAGALVANLFRKGMSPHRVRNEINTAVLPVITDVAVLKAEYREVTRRLDSIEEKLDRALER